MNREFLTRISASTVSAGTKTPLAHTGATLLVARRAPAHAPGWSGLGLAKHAAGSEQRMAAPRSIGKACGCTKQGRSDDVERGAARAKRSIVETSEVAVDRIPLRCSSASPEAPEAVARNRAIVHVWSLSEGSQLRTNLTRALTPWFLPEVRLGTLRCPTESAPAPRPDAPASYPEAGPNSVFQFGTFPAISVNEWRKMAGDRFDSFERWRPLTRTCTHSWAFGLVFSARALPWRDERHCCRARGAALPR